jgi:RimJ/RimL family protein N-acetyltransferase
MMHTLAILGEDYWGQGLASELLRGFIAKATEEKRWFKLIGGVDKNNIASSRLLVKLGFVKQPDPDDGQVVFYE